jgi:hypothetical protein
LTDNLCYNGEDGCPVVGQLFFTVTYLDLIVKLVQVLL